MDKFYSGVVVYDRGIKPVVGLWIRTNETELPEEIARDEFNFMVERYLNQKEIIAFGEITEEDYKISTNIQFTTTI